MAVHPEPDADLLRAIVNGTTDAVFVKDRDGRYLFCNDAAASILRRTAADLLGSTDADLFGPQIAAEIRAVDLRVMETGATETLEEQDLIPGTRARLLTKKFPYVDRSGATVGVIGIVRDITDKAEALLRLVIDALPVGVIVMGPNGDIVMHNRMTEQIWGRVVTSGDERWKVSRAWWHPMGKAVEPHEWASVRAMSEGVAILDQILDVEALDGTRRTVRNSAVPISGTRGVVGAVVLNEDITERMQLQASLAQAQKMEAIGRLASGVAHDFNNMLMVIYAYAQMVLDTFAATDPRRDDLEELRKAAESASGLTHQLLAFGRREITQPRNIPLETVVRETEKLLARTLGEHIRIVTQLAEPTNYVWIDARQLEQILLNLAVNARDAMPAGGELQISTRCDVPRDTAILSVRDTGTGIDEPTLARIFEPFFTTKERGKGTGLGLATVHGIVEQAGGTIRATSTVGRGTTFEIELPISRAQRAASHTAPSVPAGVGGTESILLVEDALPVRIAVRGLLVKLGYTVHHVANAAAALAHIDSGAAVDLLITDVVLTTANGRELADQIVARRPTMRVLFVSGYADDESVRSGGAALLAKPFSVEELSRAVRLALGS
jgi:two-component system cell cycle sensor histidine kinase/response regulator CckA